MVPPRGHCRSDRDLKITYSGLRTNAAVSVDPDILNGGETRFSPRAEGTHIQPVPFRPDRA